MKVVSSTLKAGLGGWKREEGADRARRGVRIDSL